MNGDGEGTETRGTLQQRLPANAKRGQNGTGVETSNETVSLDKACLSATCARDQ